DGQAVHVGDGEAGDAKVERLGPHASARARRAQPIAPVAGEEDPHVHAVGPALEPAEPLPDAGVVPTPVAVEHERPMLGPQRLPRDVRRDAPALAELEQLAALPGGRLGGPGLDRETGDGAARIGDDQVEVEIDDATEAPAALACPERAVEGEQIRGRIAHGIAALRAGECRGKPQNDTGVVGEDEGGVAGPGAEGLFKGVPEAAQVPGYGGDRGLPHGYWA